MGDRLTAGLLLLAALLGGLLAMRPDLGLLQHEPVEPRRPATPGVEQSTPGAPAQRAPVLDALTETVDRPLFSPERRPPAEQAPAEVAPLPRAEVALQPPPRLELSAVIIEPQRRLALFRAASGASLRAEEGERVEGWTLQEVRDDGVTLERDGRTHELALRTFEPPPAGAPALAPRRPVPARDAGRAQPQQAAPVPRPRRPLRGPRRRSLARDRQG